MLVIIGVQVRKSFNFGCLYVVKWLFHQFCSSMECAYYEGQCYVSSAMLKNIIYFLVT